MEKVNHESEDYVELGKHLGEDAWLSDAVLFWIGYGDSQMNMGQTKRRKKKERIKELKKTTFASLHFLGVLSSIPVGLPLRLESSLVLVAGLITATFRGWIWDAFFSTPPAIADG